MEANDTRTLRILSDDELLRRLSALVSQSHRVEADLVAHIGEVDERKLYAGQACPSMFAYCTERLHLSEAEAYRRITVARAARRHPVLLSMLRDGRLHLCGLARLVPHLTAESCEALLERATHRTTRQIEELVAELSPRPDVPAVMRKLPLRRGEPAPTDTEDGPRTPTFRGALADQLVARRVAGTPDPAGSPMASIRGLPPVAVPMASATTPAVVQPLSPDRYKVQFTAGAELRDKIERLTALMRSEVPDGDLAAVIERAVTEKLERLEARRFARTAAPTKKLSDTDTSATSRYIPAAVRRAVQLRDGGRCRFTDEQGRRCSERQRLEFHHRNPFGMGGDHSAANITLLCAAHNRLLAECDYGRTAILRRVAEPRRQVATAKRPEPARPRSSVFPRASPGCRAAE
jgi:hypothetical protein